MAGLVEMLRQIEAAEEHAKALRAEFGARAEEHCKRELEGLGQRDAYRSHLLDVLKALPWVKEEKELRPH